MRLGLGVFPATAIATVLWAGCSSLGSQDSGASARINGTGGASASAGGSTSIGNDGSKGGITTPPTPETEKEATYTLPVRSGRWVWSANPDSGKVALIDTQTLDVKLTSGGFAPTYLAPLVVEGEVESAAIVANAKSNDATVMRRVGDEVTRTTVPTHVGVNAWAVSQSGRWAIAWSNAALLKTPDPSDSFQDITLVDTTSDPPVATRLSVGYRPSRIFFQDDEARAFVVSSAGVTIVELASDGPSVSRDVALSDAPNETPIDVSVVPDGSYALFRVEGSPRVSLIELETGKRTDVVLAGPVTDLDLVAGGTTAIAVVRGQPIPDGSGGSMNTGGSTSSGGSMSSGGSTSSGGSINLGGSGGSTDLGGSGNAGDVGSGGSGGAGGAGDVGAGGDSGGAGGVSANSNSPGGSGGAEAGGAGGLPDAGGAGASSDPVPPASGYGASQVALLDVLAAAKAPKRFQSILVKDLVGSVAVAETGTMAVLYTTVGSIDRVTVLDTDPGSDAYLHPSTARVYAPVDAVFIAPDTEHALVTLRVTPGSTIGGAFGIVPLQKPELTNIETTDAPITAVAFAPSPTTSAILTAATGQTAYLVHMPSLRVDNVRLPSLPLASGIVPNEVGYVVQKHPEGRLSLINLDTAETRTLTGFELAGGIDDGK